MWVAETWETEEDVERDILLMAEYCIPTSEDLEVRNTRVPDTILQYRRQMEANLAKPLNSDIDESASYIVSGRGKGIRDRVLRPGEPIECHPLDEIELKKQIRQVSGLGYSNELIEQSLKARTHTPDQSGNSMFKLVPSSSSSSSGSSTGTVTPTKNVKPKKQSSSSSSSESSVGTVTLTKTENQDNKDKTVDEEFPPLK